MNYLAHLLLARNSDDALLGSLMGDFVRGPIPAHLPATIRASIAEHRAIDTFTDRHPIPRQSRARVRDTAGRHAGIVVDVFYDHVLAREWPRWSPETLDQFAARVYEVLTRRHGELPDRLRTVAPRLVEHDVLTSYRELAGVQRALQRIAMRARRPIDLEAALPSLAQDYGEYASDFARFFPELIAWCAARRL